jgi:hypothetical protein
MCCWAPEPGPRPRRDGHTPRILSRAIALGLFPPLQILVYRLPDVVLDRSLSVVRKPLERGDLPREQIGWVSLCDLPARAFLSSHDEILL